MRKVAQVPRGSRPLLVILPFCVLLCLFSIGCELLPPTDIQGTSSPTPTVQPILVPYRPMREVQVCLDTPPFFSADLFHQAASKVADWIDREVTLNQGGLIVYIGLITSQSFQNAVMTIKVPALAGDTPAPTPEPTYEATPGNPYPNADGQATVEAKDDQAQTQWQAAMQQRHADLSRAQGDVKQQTDALRSLKPPYDDKASDQWGCLQDTMQHFRNAPGEKYLIIASAFINNTPVNRTHLRLPNVHVRGIYRVCATAPECTERDRSWSATYLQAGAAPDVAFYDMQQLVTLDPLF